MYTTAINALQRKTLKLKSPEILYLSYFMWFLSSRWYINKKYRMSSKIRILLSLEEAFCVIYGCRQSYCINLDYFDYYTVLYKMNLRIFIFVNFTKRNRTNAYNLQWYKNSRIYWYPPKTKSTEGTYFGTPFNFVIVFHLVWFFKMHFVFDAQMKCCTCNM